MNYDEIKDKFQNKQRFDEHIECLDEHLSKYFRDEEITVFHEVVSLDFHLDVYFIKPADRKYNILLTAGMSAIAMTVDNRIEDPENYEFAELMVLVPKDIEFGEVYTGKEKNSWIISMLKQSARFPHHYDTFLAIGHTIQATADGAPYHEDTKFIGCAILPSVTFDEEFTEFSCGDNKINIYGLFPLYENELDYKRKNGYNGLLDLLIEQDIEEKLDLNRKNLLEA